MFSDAGVRDAGVSAGGAASAGGSASAGGAARAGGSAGGSVAAAGGSATAGGSASAGGASSAGGTAAAGGSATGGGSAGGTPVLDGGVLALNGADQCGASAPDVTAGGSFLGSTFMATDDYSVAGSGCPSGGTASGRDVAYLVAPAVTRTYRVVVTPLDRVLPDGGVVRFDPMLYVQVACGAGACLAGTILNGVGQPEDVTFTVMAGQTAYIVVDGELASRGDFQLDVSF